jgi:KUP system potassium uptake protein
LNGEIFLSILPRHKSQMAGDANDQRRHVMVASKGPAKESATDDASIEHTPHLHRISPAVVVTALGVVFGDLGTSPLYTLKAITQATGGMFDRSAALGSLSLIFWALIITISVKYCWFVMRADNHGEGGILALMAVTRLRWRGRKWPLIACGLFGAALLYGDGIITPAISVLSALEGIGVATDALADYAMPIAAVVLVALFAVQSLGTERVGSAFGPIMLVWFATIAVLGIVGIVQHPTVLAAANPLFAAEFLTERGFTGFAVLGAVFLAITGGEALYADMGQFGRTPIRLAWFSLVLPALLLNYAGQTALLLDGGDAAANPFYHLAPTWGLYPLVALSTLATVIASQAIISGAFSLTRQAMQLGWFPGVDIRQTSREEYGQIYVPAVNWTMMILTVALVVAFRTSDRIAGAYGTAVSTTMMLTTVLLYDVMRRVWHWPRWLALLVFGAFMLVDVAFFSANLLKISEGGWIPLLLAAVVFIAMTTWHAGIDTMHRVQNRGSESVRDFLREIEKDRRTRVPRTAVFLTRLSGRVHPLILQHVRQIGAIPQTFVALTVKFVDRPRVRNEERVEWQRIGPSFWHVTLRYGFFESPTVAKTLAKACETFAGHISLEGSLYFVERDEIVGKRGASYWWRWRRSLFAFMFRNSVHGIDRFGLPADSLVEIGRRVEM